MAVLVGLSLGLGLSACQGDRPAPTLTLPPLPMDKPEPQAGQVPPSAATASAAKPSPRPQLGAGERLWRHDATGRSEVTTVYELIQAMARADLVLLGEVHDQPLHAQRRAELLAALRQASGLPAPVVLEHATRGRTVAPGGAPADWLPALQAAGFEPLAWGWPLQQPLFGPLLVAGHRLVGGNLPRDQARRIAREGPGAIPNDLQALLRLAPLPPQARQALDADLVAGHCGHLPAARVPAMRAAQRARDAAMAQAMLQLAQTRSGRAVGAPVVLLAGNGHVRRDFGVPQVLAAQTTASPHGGRPWRMLVVGFDELAAGAPSPPAAGSAAAVAVENARADSRAGAGAGAGAGAEPGLPAPYDFTWLVPAPPRPDPCEGFALPALPASSASR